MLTKMINTAVLIEQQPVVSRLVKTQIDACNAVQKHPRLLYPLVVVGNARLLASRATVNMRDLVYLQQGRSGVSAIVISRILRYIVRRPSYH
jgi:hypothetical protein